jgi:hypothetical protein
LGETGIDVMMKYSAKIILVGEKEQTLNYKSIAGEAPEEAALSIFNKSDPLRFRPVEIGDVCVIYLPYGSYTGYFILDAGREVRQVSEGEAIIWRAMNDNPYRKVGVEAATMHELKKGSVKS